MSKDLLFKGFFCFKVKVNLKYIIMPFGKDKEHRVTSEFKKHEEEIMENARKKKIREKFHFLDAIKNTTNQGNAIIVNSQAYELVYDGLHGEFLYKKSSNLVLDSEVELQGLIKLYKEEK